MTPVIRRLGLLFISALLLGACAGADRAALSVGEESISREDLVELYIAVDSQAEETPAVISADGLRGVAGVWLNNAASAIALDESGVAMSEEERAAVDLQISDIFANDLIPELNTESAAYEALQRNLWINTKVDFLTVAVTQRSTELMLDADIESRIGVINPAGVFADPRDPNPPPAIVGR